MRKVISYLLNLSVPVTLLVIKTVSFPFHYSILVFSLLPLFAILMDLWFFPVVFQTLRRRPFRLVVYGVSLAVFFVALLSCLGVIPLMRIDAGVTLERAKLLQAIVYLIFGLFVLNMTTILRDKFRQDNYFPL